MKIEHLEVFELFQSEPGEALIKILNQNRKKLRGLEALLSSSNHKENLTNNAFEVLSNASYYSTRISEMREFYFGLIDRDIWDDRNSNECFFTESFIVKFAELHKHMTEVEEQLKADKKYIPILYLSDNSKRYYLSLDAI